jgi:hypothetical protein
MDEPAAAQAIIPTHLDATSLIPLATGLMLVILCVVVGYSAWSARIPRGGGGRPTGGEGA